ncbi:MAG: LysR family transcriptional regulator [Tepidanaerobacteraceae bacterium]|jgi:molybdate transport system regulatory protein|nr:LysR family transcriptional regulator [Tepidanaerobacteraceae bacterium]
MRLKYKIWLEADGKQVFGDGVYRLLVLIERHGSINQAAQAEKMSYRQAWGKIKQIEDRLNIKLLERRKGGESGGGANLTPQGRILVEAYGKLLKDMDMLLEPVSKKLEKFLHTGD